MRTSESKIKEAILHTEEEVRLTALAYFAERYSRDESIMPLVIQAVEKYGRDTAFRILRRADELVQTEATVQWLTDELSRETDLEDVGNDNYCCAAAVILCHTPPGLLAPGMADLPNFTEELRPAFLERLEMAAWNWEQGWDALEDLGEETRELGEFQMRHARRAKRIIEALGPHQEKADEILQLLHRRYRGRSRSLMEWLEPLIIELAGVMRLQEAIPIVVERLHEDDWGVSDSAQTALQLIGSDEVVGEIARQWANASGEFQRGAAEVMGHIHTDRSAEKCLEFLADERDDDTRNFLANAVLDNFAPEAIEPIPQMVLGTWGDLTPDESDLRYHLVAAATIMGAGFPEYDRWYAESARNRWGWHDHDRDRIRENFREDEDEEEDREEDEWGEELEESDGLGDEGIEPYAEGGLPGLLPFRHEGERAGRNAPCPCGSGKKYKKCCLRKQDTPPKFPIGTIAFYGPDDKTTTKIVAGVILEEDAEAIIERWVGTGVTTSPKVQQQIDAFFEKYGVKTVGMSEGNMGCPHEEGEDFPEGEDCPFCPFWKGKQGSGRQE